MGQYLLQTMIILKWEDCSETGIKIYAQILKRGPFLTNKPGTKSNLPVLKIKIISKTEN